MPVRWLLLFLALNGASQVKNVSVKDQEFKIRTDVELVMLDVSVKNPSGGYVSGLVKNQFQILENGVPQTITEFAVADVPVVVGLVLDQSGSMLPRRASLIEGGVALIEAGNKLDQIFVVNFNEKVRLGLPESVQFTDDIDLLRKALSIQPPQGQTALYDALALALKHLEGGSRERKTLVLISDGDDNRSKRTFKEVMRQIEESAATIYTVGLVDPADPDHKPGILKQIAAISGGECFLPLEGDPILPICQKIALDIRNRYTIGYHPVRTGDKAAVRAIRVTASSPDYKKLVVRTRTAYRLPERTATSTAGSK